MSVAKLGSETEAEGTTGSAHKLASGVTLSRPAGKTDMIGTRESPGGGGVLGVRTPQTVKSG